jgi:hypothetical protein
MRFKSTWIGFLIGFILINTFFITSPVLAKAPVREFYQLIVYHIKDKAQEERLDKYLSEAYVPALRRLGIKTVGVFKTANIDTAKDKRMYVLVPHQSLQQFHSLNQRLEKDQEYTTKGADYINASFDNAPYVRKESIIMQAFKNMPVLKKPVFNAPKNTRVYELRSYESATEKISLNKINMFNDDEMEIFVRIGSQPVFYGEVLAGSRMPNMMYMTSYSDKASRDAHWKTFGSDPAWKRISALPKYKKNMDRMDVQFLTPTSYSDI